MKSDEQKTPTIGHPYKNNTNFKNLSHELEDVSFRARSDWHDNLLVSVDKKRHGAAVATRCLDVPLLSSEIAFIK